MGKIKNLSVASREKLRILLQTYEGSVTVNGIHYHARDLNSPINFKKTGLIPIAGHFLHYAILQDDKALVKDLCNNGANVNWYDEKVTRRVPLQLASDYGRASIAKILIEKNASTKGIKIVYEINPCTQPLTFIWSMKQTGQGKEVDYEEIATQLQSAQNNNTRKKKLK